MADLHLDPALRQAVERTLGPLTFTTLTNRPTVIPTATAVPTATITAAACNSVRGNEGHFHPTKILAYLFSWTGLKSVLAVTFLAACWMLIILLLGISVFQVLSKAFPLGENTDEGENADEGEKKYYSCCRKCGGCVMDRGIRLGSESGSGSGSASNHDADNKDEAEEKAGEQQNGDEERQDEEEEKAEKEYREAEEKEYLRREEEERRLRWEMSDSSRKAARLVAEFREKGLDT
jgi:hypothetical protein